jgi:hypothetical protein
MKSVLVENVYESPLKDERLMLESRGHQRPFFVARIFGILKQKENCVNM